MDAVIHAAQYDDLPTGDLLPCDVVVDELDGRSEPGVVAERQDH